MIFSKYQKDGIIVDETNYKTEKEKSKMHLIKLDFSHPTKEKVRTVINNFPHTNRYVVSNNIKFYNYILKNNKKYYVENEKGSSLISFFRKNNKILLNMNNLTDMELQFIMENIHDILDNVEVIFIGEKDGIDEATYFKIKSGNGNVLIG